MEIPDSFIFSKCSILLSVGDDPEMGGNQKKYKWTRENSMQMAIRAQDKTRNLGDVMWQHFPLRAESCYNYLFIVVEELPGEQI